MNEINNYHLETELDWAARVVECACYDLGAPVRVHDSGIIVLGNQVRISAQPVESRAQFAELQRHIKVNGRAFNPSTPTVLKLKNIQKDGVMMIKRKLKLSHVSPIVVELNTGNITFDFCLSDLVGDEDFIQLHVNDLPEPKPNWIPIGRTLESETVFYRPDEVTHCHVLIAGMTGSGKTVLTNTIISGLLRAYTPDELHFLLASGKPEDINIWNGAPHLIHEPTYDPDAAFAMLEWLVEERERRSKIQEKGPRIVLCIGELSELVRINPKEFSDSLEILMRLGRSEKINIIAATQHARSDQIGSSISRAQFPLVLAGKLRDPSASYVALGIGQSKAETLPGKGAFVSNNGVRFQAAFSADGISQEFIREIILEMQRLYEPNEHIKIANTGRKMIDKDTVEDDTGHCIMWIEECEITEISASRIQRELKWGYLRASRVFDNLEKRGIIGERPSRNKAAPVIWNKS